MKLQWKSWNAELEHKCWAEADSVDTEDSDFAPYVKKAGPDVIFTPVGIYYKDSPNRPANRWECFTCYTDFDIANSKFSSMIDEIEGVEAYKPLGKYTFFIGFGKLFDPQEIRKKINEKAEEYVKS